MYDDFSDTEFLHQSDVPVMLTHLQNGYGGKVTAEELRRLLDTGTRPAAIYAQISGLIARGYVSKDQNQLLHITKKGEQAPIYDGPR